MCVRVAFELSTFEPKSNGTFQLYSAHVNENTFDAIQFLVAILLLLRWGRVADAATNCLLLNGINLSICNSLTSSLRSQTWKTDWISHAQYPAPFIESIRPQTLMDIIRTNNWAGSSEYGGVVEEGRAMRNAESDDISYLSGCRVVCV